MCKQIYALEHFYARSGWRTAYCKKCMVQYQTGRARDVKYQAVIYKGGKCERCNYDRNFSALEFHHKDPAQKDFNITHKCSSFEKIRPELDKCELLCANCHREEHNPDMRKKEGSNIAIAAFSR